MKNIHQNREISVLSFNERVLQEAEDRRNPLMERLNFLGIFSSNMDEFFKVRVASIHRRMELGKEKLSAVLELIGESSRDLDERFQQAYAAITKALAQEGIQLLTEKDMDGLGEETAEWLREYFRTNVLPTLVPIIVDERHRFPRLTDGALYFAVRMWGGDNPPYSILEIPSELPRFVDLPDGSIMYVDDVIRYSLNEVYYIFRYDRIEAFEFKISRDAELDIDNDFSEGYVRKMERVLEQRKGGRPTRFVYDRSIPPGLRQLLLQALQLSSEDTIIGGGRYHNMKDLMRFPRKRPDMSYKQLTPAKHPVLDRSRRAICAIAEEQDVMMTYPYQSFDHLVRFLREAAIDPEVEEIKLTLYRAAQRSQVVNALVNAARNGKSVFVSVELLARFDERHNIDLAERLTEVGATVTYGVPPMKVHCKLLLIKRRGKRFAALSTGNYNETTARLYVDSTLVTAHAGIADDVDEVFRFLGHASVTRSLTTPKFKHLIVSPFGSRKALLRHIGQEEEKGKDGYIFLKVNHLTDAKVSEKLVQAADAGVTMEFVVRTTYTLPPHKNIRAISILDRFLEHQRVYIFGRGEDQRVYMSSSDLMERNLDWRVEVAFPVYDPILKQQVVDTMNLQINDTYKARVLDMEQSNRYVEGKNGQQAQMETYRYFKRLYKESGAREAERPRVPA